MDTAPINLPGSPNLTPGRKDGIVGPKPPVSPTQAAQRAARDNARTGRLDPTKLGVAVDLDALNVPPPPGAPAKTVVAGLGLMGVAGVALQLHDQVQGTVRKTAENYQDLRNNLENIKRFKAGQLPAAAAPLQAGNLRTLGPLSTSSKIFAGARVLRGLDSAVNLAGDARSLRKDLAEGNLGKVGLDGLRTLGDGLGTMQGVEAGLKLAGREIAVLNVTRTVTAASGAQVLKKIPVIGLAFAGVDLTTKGIELARGVDSNGKPLPTNRKVGDVASMVGDIATVIAFTTPPPIDAVAGVVAAGAALVQVGAEHWDDVKHAGAAVVHAASAVEGAVASGAHKLVAALHFW
jgi:hypothetical protein